MKVCLRQAVKLYPVLGEMHAPFHQLGCCRKAPLKQPPQRRAAAPKAPTSLKARHWEDRVLPDKRHHDMPLSLGRTFTLQPAGKAAGRVRFKAKCCGLR